MGREGLTPVLILTAVLLALFAAAYVPWYKSTKKDQAALEDIIAQRKKVSGLWLTPSELLRVSAKRSRHDSALRGAELTPDGREVYRPRQRGWQVRAQGGLQASRLGYRCMKCLCRRMGQCCIASNRVHPPSQKYSSPLTLRHHLI